MAKTLDPGLTTSDVLNEFRSAGYPLTEWGKAVDGTPMLAARAGGTKQPAIFITAGAHSTETAGVHAAVNLLRTLETEHEVIVLPLRDPFGFAGAAHCLSVGAGRQADISSHEMALEYLKQHGRLLRSEEDVSLFELGDYGFIWGPAKPGLDAFWEMYSQIAGRWLREEPEAFRSLWGRPVMLLMDLFDVEGSGGIQRCWHGVMSEKGEWLHLNRFFGRSDAPAEVAAVDKLMQTVRPGLTCDLHEGYGSGFWTTIPKPKDDPERVFDMTSAFFDYISARGYPIMEYGERAAKAREFNMPYTPDWITPEPRVPGFFWVNGGLRGEGPNLMDYAENFGIGYGTESSIELPLAMRVDVLTNGILAAIKVWEETV